jgi:hypothetical protein
LKPKTINSLMVLSPFYLYDWMIMGLCPCPLGRD